MVIYIFELITFTILIGSCVDIRCQKYNNYPIFSIIMILNSVP